MISNHKLNLNISVDNIKDIIVKISPSPIWVAKLINIAERWSLVPVMLYTEEYGYRDLFEYKK